MLSTPSLGITGPTSAGHGSCRSPFQLPLSGSLVQNQSEKFICGITFNSLSRDHPVKYLFYEFLNLTFNSLSRDHGHEVRWNDVDSQHLLSTPSLGITIENRLDQINMLLLKNFQLPLSGSPSPIPGFSGSPRLSAAAPLRTNDF